MDVDGNDTVDINLPLMGANPLRKDIFLEVDWMADCVPVNRLWQYSDSVFRNAPVLNSDGSTGISLHIDHGQDTVFDHGGDVLPFVYGIHFGTEVRCPYEVGSGRGCINFHILKRRFFDPVRLRVFRYCIFGKDNANGVNTFGMSEGYLCNDFYVTQTINPRVAVDTFALSQIGAFLHEFGHTFGLMHGGEDDLRRKPNYNSVLQYSYSGIGIDEDCNPATYDFRLFTYSQGMRRSLNEACLNEPEGICDNVPIDWNRDGQTTGMCIRAHIHDDTAITVLRDYSDWAFMKIDFTGPLSRWHED
jgi:hypothetical protein